MIFSEKKKHQTKDSLTAYVEAPQEKSSKWPLKLAGILALAGGVAAGVHYAQQADSEQPVLNTEVADDLQSLEQMGDEMNLVAEQQEPPNQLEMPYESTWKIGVGVDSQSCNEGICDRRANPFGQVADPTIDRATENDIIKKYIVTTAFDEAKQIGVNGMVELGGWGVQAKAQIAMKYASQLESQEIKFIAQRDLIYGYRGWHSSQPLTDNAKNMLCNNKKRFHDIYGDYYVSGHKMGSSIKFEISAKTETTNTNMAVSAGLEADFGSMFGPGTSLKGKGDFQMNLNKNKAISSSQLRVQAKGQKVGYTYKGITMDNANDELLRFPENAMEGTGVATVIRSYETLDDYIAVLNDPKCHSDYQRVVKKSNQYAEDMFYEQIFALIQLQGMLKDNNARIIPDDTLSDFEYEVLEKLMELSEVSEGGVTLEIVKKYSKVAQTMIDRFFAMLNQYKKTDFCWSVFSSATDGGNQGTEFTFMGKVYNSKHRPREWLRGAHVLAFDLTTKQNVHNVIYDTHRNHGQIREINDYLLHHIGFNRIVMIAAYDEMIYQWKKNNREDICKKIGCKILPHITYRNSYALAFTVDNNGVFNVLGEQQSNDDSIFIRSYPW